MSMYPPNDRRLGEKELKAALAGIPFLTASDMIELMGVDSKLCGREDYAMAEWDLRTMGYREGRVGIWGHRAIFPRYIRHEVWPEDEQAFASISPCRLP